MLLFGKLEKLTNWIFSKDGKTVTVNPPSATLHENQIFNFPDAGTTAEQTLATTSNKISDFAACNSAELAGKISDETGYASGAKAVFSDSPTFINQIVTPEVEVTNGAQKTEITRSATAANYTLSLPDTNGTLAVRGDKLSAFAATTSAELAGVISDETGSNALVFANTPTLVTPKVDSISEATGNAGVTIDGVLLKDQKVVLEDPGAGSNKATLQAPTLAGDVTITLPAATSTLIASTDKLNALASTSSAELAGVISDETGSGALVFGTSPTIATPKIDSIGEATGDAGVTVDGVLLKDGAIVLEETGAGTDKVTLTAPASIAVDITVTLPSVTSTLIASTDKISALAATSSAELAGVLSDETGYASGGLAVFSKSPTIDTPVFNTSATSPKFTGPAASDAALNAVTGQSAKITVNDAAIVTVTGTSVGIAAAAPLTVNNTTASTDKDTGALIVQGGVGVEGSVFAGTGVTAPAVSGTTSVTTPKLAPISANTVIDIDTNAAINLPSGTTAQRPGTAVLGDFRFNTTELKLEVCTAAGTPGEWSAAGSGGTVIKVAQAGIGTGTFVGQAVYLAGSTWTLANHTTAVTAEVVGLISKITDSGNIELTLGGEVTGIAFADVFETTPADGDVVWLGTTTGKLTTTAPTTVGYILKPQGVVRSKGATTCSVMYCNMRGDTVGGTNLYSSISLAIGATTFYTITCAAGEGGWISGTIKYDGTADYVIPFFCFFSKQLDNSYNVSPFYGSTVPAGLTITNSTSAVQITLPADAGFVSSSVKYCVQAAASGTTLPVSVSASSVLGSTTGSAPAAGVIGESLAFTSRTVTGSSGNWTSNTTKLVTLTPGVWSIRAMMEFASNNTASVVIGAVATNSTADNTGRVARTQVGGAQVSGAALNSIIPLWEMQLVVVSSSQDIYAKSYSEDASVNVTIEGFALRVG
jgi:hypothetical protein